MISSVRGCPYRRVANYYKRDTDSSASAGLAEEGCYCRVPSRPRLVLIECGGGAGLTNWSAQARVIWSVIKRKFIDK